LGRYFIQKKVLTNYCILNVPISKLFSGKFGYICIMAKYRISTTTVRKANIRLIKKGVPSKLNGQSNGCITIEYKVGNLVKTRHIKKTDFNKAYEKALNEYREGI